MCTDRVEVGLSVRKEAPSRITTFWTQLAFICCLDSIRARRSVILECYIINRILYILCCMRKFGIIRSALSARDIAKFENLIRNKLYAENQSRWRRLHSSGLKFQNLIPKNEIVYEDINIGKQKMDENLRLGICFVNLFHDFEPEPLHRSRGREGEGGKEREFFKSVK